MKLKREVNRNNMLAFAKHLYHVTPNNTWYIPLCQNNLVERKGECVVGCVLAEMYEFFVGRDSFKVINEKFPGGQADWYVEATVDEDEIANILAYKTKVSPQVKTPFGVQEAHTELRNAIFSLPNVNDESGTLGNPESTLIRRAHAVSDAVTRIAWMLPQ